MPLHHTDKLQTNFLRRPLRQRCSGRATERSAYGPHCVRGEFPSICGGAAAEAHHLARGSLASLHCGRTAALSVLTAFLESVSRAQAHVYLCMKLALKFKTKERMDAALRGSDNPGGTHVVASQLLDLLMVRLSRSRLQLVMFCVMAIKTVYTNIVERKRKKEIPCKKGVAEDIIGPTSWTLYVRVFNLSEY